MRFGSAQLGKKKENPHHDLVHQAASVYAVSAM